MRNQALDDQVQCARGPGGKTELPVSMHDAHQSFAGKLLQRSPQRTFFWRSARIHANIAVRRK